MIDATFLGYIAAVLTTFSFVPQVYKIWRQRSAKDISIITFFMFTVGIFCWLVYGIQIGSWPVTAANAVTFVLSSIILYFKIKFK